jgi:hypothetical protein
MNYAPFSKKGSVITMTSDEHKILIDRANQGTSPGGGWGVYEDVVCEYCEHIWTAFELLGTKGKRCPHCGHLEPDFVWLPAFKGTYGDGTFLTPVGWEHTRLNLN